MSVVIPARDAESFIAETVESVLAQTRPPVEVIVVDDGSTDGTADVLRRFGERIRVLTQPWHGAAAARNAGAAVASGTWLAFLDADDTWLPEKLERQLAVAAAQRVGMVFSDRYNVGARGGLPPVQSQLQRMYSGDVFLDLLVLGNHITLSSAIVRADLFRSLGGFSETLTHAEDWDFWIRLAEGHRVGVCHEPLVCYRLHQGMKSSNPHRMQAARDEIVRRALRSARGRALSSWRKRRIRAATARTNGFDAARAGEGRLAVRAYSRSLMGWPFDGELFRDIARLLLGRGRW